MFFLHIGACATSIVLLTALLRDDEDIDMSTSGMADVSVREMEDAYEKRLTAAKTMSAVAKVVRGEGLASIYGEISGLVRSPQTESA